MTLPIIVSLRLPKLFNLFSRLETTDNRTPGGLVDRVVTGASVLGVAVPDFILAPVLVLLFALFEPYRRDPDQKQDGSRCKQKARESQQQAHY